MDSDIDSEDCDGGKKIHEVGCGSQSKNKPLDHYLDHEIAQLTRLKSEPHTLLSQVGPGRGGGFSVSTLKMLAGRECNYSGKGRFSSADCCRVLSRYLPVNGSCLIDQMNSEPMWLSFRQMVLYSLPGFRGVILEFMM